MTWPFENLQMFGYGLIMADPAWSFHNWSPAGRGAHDHYDCMDLEDIKALPVNQLAGRDCLLWLWATNPMLPDALEVMAAWGFTFKTAGTWVKQTVKGNLHFGTGYVLRSASEPFLIGSVGSPALAKNVRGVVTGAVREHSRKPDEAYEAAERLVPNVWRADLFSRQSREGWDSWGNERTKFDRKDVDNVDEGLCEGGADLMALAEVSGAR